MGKGTAHGPGPFAATHRSPYTPLSIFVHGFTKARGPLRSSRMTVTSDLIAFRDPVVLVMRELL